MMADRRHHLRLSLAPERQRLVEGSAPGRSQAHIPLAPIGTPFARDQPVALQRSQISRQRRSVHDQPFGHLAQGQLLALRERHQERELRHPERAVLEGPVV